MAHATKKALTILLGQCVPSVKSQASKIRIRRMELDENLLMVTQELRIYSTTFKFIFLPLSLVLQERQLCIRTRSKQIMQKRWHCLRYKFLSFSSFTRRKKSQGDNFIYRFSKRTTRKVNPTNNTLRWESRVPIRWCCRSHIRQNCGGW